MGQALPEPQPVAFFAGGRFADCRDRDAGPVFHRIGRESGIGEQLSWSSRVVCTGHSELEPDPPEAHP